LVDVNLKVEGWIRDVFVNYVGQPVRSGQPLIAVFSPELEALQANLLGAIRARDQTPVAQSADGLEYASRLVDTPRQRLRQLDVAEEELHAIEGSGRPASTVVFRSPMNGVIVEKNVVKGMHAAAGEMLYRIADLSVVRRPHRQHISVSQRTDPDTQGADRAAKQFRAAQARDVCERESEGGRSAGSDCPG
jgi:hypothetical protein